MPEPAAYLVTGSDELLVRREADRVLERLRAGGELDVTDVRADELKERGLPDLRTASLFGTPRAVRIRDAQNMPVDSARSLLEQLEGNPPDATVILQASGTGQMRKLAQRIKELGGRIDVGPPKDWEERKWNELVTAEFARHGRQAEDAARRSVLDHAGLDVGVIAEKVAQVVAAAPAGWVTAAQVEDVVVGRGDRGAFAVADAMCERDPAQALALLRGVLEAGNDPLMVLGALTYRLRTVVAVAGDVTGKATGISVSEGQARRLRRIRSNFGPGEMTAAYRALADADFAIKAGDLDPELAIERAVTQIATPPALTASSGSRESLGRSALGGRSVGR